MPSLEHICFCLADVDVWQIFVLCLAMIVVIILGAAGVMLLRRWMQQPEETATGGFTLASLRELHRSGKMTAEEYEKARAMIVGVAKRESAPPPAKPPGSSIRGGQ